MEWLTDFHFIRPLWLLAIVPALAMIWLLRPASAAAGDWQKVIDPQLLPYLMDDSSAPTSRRTSPLWRALMVIAALVTALALAGPTWEKIPQPVHKNQDALLILLDMSLSMGAQDLKPSRYVRATQKITDIIRARRDGQTALIVYAGDAHTVTPLTDDHKTIENLLPALSPFIMPAPGSRPDKAIELAQQLSAAAGVNKAELLLITDGLQDKDTDRIRKALDPARSHLSVIALGTAEGAPVPLPGSGFLRDGSGTIVLPQLDLGPIRALNSTLGIDWRTLTLDDSDWQALLDPDLRPATEDDLTLRQFDQWSDQGYWLILLLLPLALLLFRRGVVLAFVLAIPLTFSDNSYAVEWQDLWQTPDQKGQALFESDPETAARTFHDPAWAGSAAYRSGNYQQALEHWSTLPESPENLYNLGNAQAMNGQLQDAEASYQKALQQQPDFPQAQENLERVRQALKQQEQQQNQQDSQSGDSDQQDQQQGQQQDQNQQGQSQQGDDQNSQSADGQQNKDSAQQDAQSSKQDNAQQDAEQQGKQRSAEQDDTEEPADKAASADENGAAENDDKSEQDAAASQSDEDSDGDQQAESAQQAMQQNSSSLSREEQEAMQQWLNRVPDEPGNLLQRKFLYQYRQNNDQSSEDVLW